MTDHGALAMHVHVCACMYYGIIIMTIVCMCVHPVMRQKELCYGACACAIHVSIPVRVRICTCMYNDKNSTIAVV